VTAARLLSQANIELRPGRCQLLEAGHFKPSTLQSRYCATDGKHAIIVKKTWRRMVG